jgi:hypothetical protein
MAGCWKDRSDAFKEHNSGIDVAYLRRRQARTKISVHEAGPS